METFSDGLVAYTVCVNWFSNLQTETINSGLSVAHVAYWNS